MISLRFAYLFGNIVPLFIWLILFLKRRDERKEMLVMSVLIGILSVVTGYYWWTVDWWQPMTITGTKIGIEDFLIGFSGGGIMAVAYEEIFKKRHERIRKHRHYPGPLTLFLLLAFATSFLIWGTGLTSFIASTIAMVTTAGFMFFYRRDLLMNGILSGILMAITSLLFYFPIMITQSNWIQATYLFDNLSKIFIFGIPIEELIFWFLAGLLFGPFYEYWQGERLRKQLNN